MLPLLRRNSDESRSEVPKAPLYVRGFHVIAEKCVQRKRKLLQHTVGADKAAVPKWSAVFHTASGLNITFHRLFHRIETLLGHSLIPGQLRVMQT